MSTDNRKYVQDNLSKMHEHCINVAYMRHNVDSLKTLKANVVYQYAFTNALAQIGEHAKRIDIWLENHSTYDWKGCYRFRDLVDHNYPKVDFENVWYIINEDIPDMMILLDELIELSMTLPDSEFIGITSDTRKKEDKKEIKGLLSIFKRKKY